MGQKNTKSGESKGKSSSTSRKGGTDGRTRRKHSPGSVDEEDNGGSGGTGPKYTSEEISEMERKFNEQMKKEVIDTEKSKMSKYGRRFSIALKQPPYQEQPAPEYQAQSPSQPSFLAATSTAFSAIDGANTGGCDDDGTGTGTGTSPKREKSRRLKRSERKKANRASMPPSTAALLELRFGEEARKELEIEQKMHQRHHQHHHSGSGSGSGMGSGSGSGIQRKSASPARFGTSPPHSGSSSLSPMEPSQVAFQSSSSISPQSSSSPYIGNNIYINNSTNSTNNNNNNNSNNNNNTSINNNNNSSNSSNNINDNSNNSINEKRSWGRRRSHTVIKKPEKQEKADKSEKSEKPEKPEKSSKKKLQWHRSSILITTSEISNYNSSLSGAGGGGGGSSFTPSSLSSSSNSPAVGLQPSHPQVSQLNLAQVQQQNQLQNSGNSGGSSGSAAAANGGNETPGKRRWLRFGRRNSRVVSTEFSREYLQNTLDSYAQQPPSSSPRPSLTNSPATYTISQPQSSRQRSKGGDLGAGVSPPTADRLSGLSSSGSKSRGYSEMPPSALSQQEFKPDGQVESPRFKKADSPTLKPSATATSSSSSSSSSLMNRATRKRSNSTILAKYHKKGSQHALAIPSDQQRQHSQSQEPKTIMSLPHKSYLSSSLQQIQADKQSQSQTQLQPQSQSQQSYHHHYDQSLEGGSGSGSNGSGGGSGAGGSGSSNDTATHHRQRSKTISSLRHSMHLQKHQKQPSPSDHTSSPQASSSPLSHLHEQPQTQPQQQSQIQSQQHQHQHLHQQQQQEEEEELSSSQQSQSSSRHSYHQHQQAPKPELPSMLIQQRSPLMESCGDTSTDIQSAEKDDDDDGAIVSPSPPTPQLQQSPTQKPKYQLQLQQLQLQQLQLQQQQQHTLHAKTPSTSSSSSSATTASIPPVPSPIAATPSQLSALSPGTVTLNVPSLPSPPSPRKMTPETTMLPTPTTQNAVSPPFQSSSATSAFLKKPKTKPKLKKLEVSPTTTLFPTANERGITPPSPSSPLSPSSASSALSSSSAYVAQIPLQQPPPLVLPRFRVPKVPQAPVRAGSQAGSISPSPVTQSPPSSGGLSKLPYYRHKSNLSKMSIASTRSSSASTMVSDYESSAAESDTCSTASSYLGSTVASSSSSSSSSSTSSSSSSSSSSTISGIGADGSVVSRSGYGEESDAMSFESVSTTSSFVPAQIVKKEQEKKSKRSHRCANNGTYRATLFSDTQPYKVAKSLNPQSNNLSLVQVRYEKEGDSAASSLWTFAVDPECTGYDLCLSVLQTDPATQTMAMMRARKGMDVRALASLGVRLYKVDESDISQSQLQSHSHQSKSQRNSKSDKPKEGESNAVVIINNTNNDDDDDNNDDDDDDDDNNDDEFDPSAPNVTQVPPGDRIAAHTSSWKSGRDGYFVVYDTSKVFTPTSPTNTARGDSITLGGPTSSSSTASNSKKASPAILVDMRTGSSSGEQTSEAWIPEEDIFWVSRISSGSFSRVYKGIYKGKYVAIKILKGGLCVRNIDEFRKEFRVMKSVRHQNLLECYGASFEHNKLSYVIEYCQRGTLLHVMTDPSLKIGWDHAADFFAQALRGLQFLHEHDPPIVHRDLKSQNLLVTRSYEIKIGDFGLSRFNTASNNPTLSNMCGTMTHCAPEIFSGDLFTPKADIYSMGMILWELCTRVATGSYAPPYSEYPNIVLDIQIIAQAATKHLRPTIPASVPKKFADLIARCWDKDPEVRPDTTELLRIVEEFPQKRMSLFNRPNRKFSSLNANKKRSVRNPNSDTLASNSSTSSSQNSHSSAFPPVTPPPPLPPPVNPGGSNGNTPVSTSTGPSNTSYSTSSSFPMSTPSPQLPSHL